MATIHALARDSSVPSGGRRQREDDGWRTGKPMEDPEKLKRWGFVTAKPSEYLVHVRGGKLRPRSSGQGATCFKWPHDAVAVVPTSLQRLQFRADQVTAEKVGVEVVGLAVYRIAEPLLAFRVLNFSFPERAQEKLEETLTAMFIGAARRLIANLTIEDCLQKRKSALATELLREVAPVVGGKGSPADSTAQGWGLVIDTIEIQEVRVLSERIFTSMQTPYRSALEQRAREAKALAEKEVQTHEALFRRETEEARLGAEAAIADRQRQLARAGAESEAELAMRKSQLSAERSQAELEAQGRVRETQLAAERAEAEAASEAAILALARQEAEARAATQAHAARAEAYAQQAELHQAQAKLAAEVRRIEADAARAEGEAAVAVEWQRAQIEAERATAQARIIQAQKLPELAAAIGQRIGEVRIAQYGGEGNPFGSITQAVAAVLDLVRDPRPNRD